MTDRNSPDLFSLERMPAGRATEPDDIAPRRDISAVFPVRDTLGRVAPLATNNYSLYVDFHRAAQRHPTILSAFRRIADGLTSAPIQVVKTSRRARPIGRRRFLEFLFYGNPQHSWHTRLYALILKTLIIGNAYAEVQWTSDGRPATFYPIEGFVKQCRKENGEWGTPALLQQSHVNEPANVEGIPFNLGEFLCVSRPGTINAVYGASALGEVFEQVVTDLLAQKGDRQWAANVLKTSGILTMPAGLSDEEMKRNRAEIRKAYQGAQNQGMPFMTLSGDVDYKPVIDKMSDATAQVSSREWGMKIISAITGVPIVYLRGEPGTHEDQRYFVEFGLRPIATLIEEAINTWARTVSFCPGWEMQFELPLPVEPRAMARLVQTGTRAGFLTINEGRRLLFGNRLPSVEGGDELRPPEKLYGEEAQRDDRPTGNEPGDTPKSTGEQSMQYGLGETADRALEALSVEPLPLTKPESPSEQARVNLLGTLRFALGYPTPQWFVRLPTITREAVYNGLQLGHTTAGSIASLQRYADGLAATLNTRVLNDEAHRVRQPWVEALKNAWYLGSRDAEALGTGRKFDRIPDDDFQVLRRRTDKDPTSLARFGSLVRATESAEQDVWYAYRLGYLHTYFADPSATPGILLLDAGLNPDGGQILELSSVYSEKDARKKLSEMAAGTCFVDPTRVVRFFTDTERRSVIHDFSATFVAPLGGSHTGLAAKVARKLERLSKLDPEHWTHADVALAAIRNQLYARRHDAGESFSSCWGLA